MDAHLFDARQMCKQAVARPLNLLRNRLNVNGKYLRNENLFAKFYDLLWLWNATHPMSHELDVESHELHNDRLNFSVI